MRTCVRYLCGKVISLDLEAGLCETWSQDSEGQLHYELLLYLL